MKLFLRFLISRSLYINLAIVLILGGVLIFGCLKALDVYTNHGESITVPDFRDKVYGDVVKELQETNKKLQVVILDSTYQADKPPLAIIDHDPKPWEQVKENRTIYLTVNAINPPKVAIPDLDGVSLQYASLKLENLGLKVGKLSYRPHYAQNAVLKLIIDNKPVAIGTKIVKGTTIDLELGDGLSDNKVNVPSLIGSTLEEAEFIVRNHGLNIGFQQFDTSVHDTPAAIIYRQIPHATEELVIRMGEAVDIYLTQNSDTLVKDTVTSTTMPSSEPPH